MLSKAIEIATRAHYKQVDKAGVEYIQHPLRVMEAMGDDVLAKICAVLHDTVEDTLITLDDLRVEGFSEEIIAALDCLTKREGETYETFIDRIKLNPLARKVKLADLEDNMDLSRLNNPTAEDYKNYEKYNKAKKRIESYQPMVGTTYYSVKSGALLKIENYLIYCLNNFAKWEHNQQLFSWFYDDPVEMKIITETEALEIIEQVKQNNNKFII
jgi:hypothetical protein